MPVQPGPTAQSPVDGLRICKLPYCAKGFSPIKKNQLFCCVDHKKEFHKLAYRMGEKAIEALHEIRR